MCDQHNDDIWMPYDVWENKDLTANEKFYYAAFLQNNKNISAAETFLKEIYSANTIRKTRHKLCEKGYIKQASDKKLNPEEIRKKVISIAGTGQSCEWCGSKNYILQEHHYPILKANGGTEVVRICPNCHANFHFFYNAQDRR